MKHPNYTTVNLHTDYTALFVSIGYIVAIVLLTVGYIPFGGYTAYRKWRDGVCNRNQQTHPEIELNPGEPA